MKRLLILPVLWVCLVLPATGLRAQVSPEAQYLAICDVIQQADDAGRHGAATDALAKYQQADSHLKAFKEDFPKWNANVVNLRLNYLASRISIFKAATPQSPVATVATASQVAPSATSSSAATLLADAQRKLNTQAEAAAILIAEANTKLEKQTQRVTTLTQERDTLQQQVQAASAQSTELARLRTENESLKQQLAAKPVAPAGKTDELNQQLSQVRAQLALTQSERDGLQKRIQAAATDASAVSQQLRIENDSLKRQLADLKSKPAPTAKVDDVNRQLKQVQAQLALAETERDTLRKQAVPPVTISQTMAQLRLDNENLRRQLADSKGKPSPDRSADLDRQLKQVQGQLALAQSEQTTLRADRAALEEKLRASSSTADSASARDAERIKQLEQERDDLQRKLVAATRSEPKTKSAAASGQVDDLMSQLAALRTRLDVYEAKPVPYTTEELALFKQPSAPVAATVPPPAQTSKSGSSVDATLISQAHRHFAAGELDKAEQKYTEALKVENQDVRAYCNLATIQAQENRITEAEKTIDQALAIDPNDATSLGVLGYLKLRQDKNDDALDALGRAVKTRPQDPRIQNMLGLALSHSGQRGPAETAFRKALQTDPNFADAHANLATIYITQKPTAMELARWHYQRAVAAGSPRNPDMEKLLQESQAADTTH